jgi:hypothetical protein
MTLVHVVEGFGGIPELQAFECEGCETIVTREIHTPI